MWNRLRKLAHLMVDVVISLVILGFCGAYIGISSFIVTQVINDLRLDTYIDFSTGFGIISLVLLLVWAPIWLMRERRLHR